MRHANRLLKVKLFDVYLLACDIVYTHTPLDTHWFSYAAAAAFCGTYLIGMAIEFQ